MWIAECPCFRISEIRHGNLVQLQGWCNEKGLELLLVYDYIPNKSFDKWIFNDSVEQESEVKCRPSAKTSALKVLSWDVLYNIHTGSQQHWHICTRIGSNVFCKETSNPAMCCRMLISMSI
jgi:hypothetical protein